jgi:putative transposase
MLSLRKELVSKAIKKYNLSIRHACKIFCLSRTAYYYVNKTSEDSGLDQRILALANSNPSYGYWKIYYLLRDEGYIVNHKRVYRIYKKLGLTISGNKRCREPQPVNPNNYSD